jgi:molybdopterin-guanine dinucleotide biosynthesis protein A
MQPHRKHGKTNLANFGNFGRMEIAIMGTPCGEIKKLANQLIHQLRGFKIAYVDADHKTDEEDVPQQIQDGATMVFTDKIKFNRIDINASLDKFQRNRLFNEYDLVLVNGNHFEAGLQIVVVDDRKPLEKNLKKITNPVAILRGSEQTRLPEYLENHLGKELEIQPLYNIAEVEKVSDLIRDLLLLNVPRLNGLVLAGGKSERMGQDKGKIDYHGMPQREYLYTMLEGLTENTFMSCRPDQVAEFDASFKTLPDSIAGLGPFGAIISAFREFPNHAWLVVACDIPLISRNSLLQLIGERNPSKMATTFFNNETGFPDPLVTIWEPKAYPEMLHFLSLGYSCPRKVLINSQVQIIHPSDPKALLNANSPEEYERVKEILSEQKK